MWKRYQIPYFYRNWTIINSACWANLNHSCRCCLISLSSIIFLLFITRIFHITCELVCNLSLFLFSNMSRFWNIYSEKSVSHSECFKINHFFLPYKDYNLTKYLVAEFTELWRTCVLYDKINWVASIKTNYLKCIFFQVTSI